MQGRCESDDRGGVTRTVNYELQQNKWNIISESIIYYYFINFFLRYIITG
jgi:hypothetical protein